jgi:cytochrome c oxidase assembly protein subunit 15
LVLLCAVALLLTAFWGRLVPMLSPARLGSLRWLLPLATGLIFLQLVLGALMRHQHAGLAIHDFPLAYGQLWPATDAGSLARYNQARVEDTSVTAFQIGLQMFHRLGAVAAVTAVWAAFAVAWRRLGWSSPVTRLATAWAALLATQFALGAATLWSDKAADIATTHVAVGALSLVTGTLLTMIARKLMSVPAAVPPEPLATAAFARPSVR